MGEMFGNIEGSDHLEHLIKETKGYNPKAETAKESKAEAKKEAKAAKEQTDAELDTELEAELAEETEQTAKPAETKKAPVEDEAVELVSELYDAEAKGGRMYSVGETDENPASGLNSEDGDGIIKTNNPNVTNKNTVSNGYVSNELLEKFEYGIGGDFGRDLRRKLGGELQGDIREPQNNQSGVSKNDENQRGIINDRDYSSYDTNILLPELYSSSVSHSITTLESAKDTSGGRLYNYKAIDKTLDAKESIAVRQALAKLIDMGFQIEVACKLCYVESARLKSPAQIKKFLENKEQVLIEFLKS